ncbi:MAG TPA: magnesium transporter CorA family protein [Dehalococcoidales bacterium]
MPQKQPVQSVANTPAVNQEPTLNIESVALGDLTWLNIEKPTLQETGYLAQHYPFHALDLDDTLSRIQRPKIDEYEDYIFVVLHFPVWHRETQIATASQVSLFIGRNYVVTMHGGEIRLLREFFQNCMNSDTARQENMGQGSAFLAYKIIDILVDRCFTILDRILGWTDAVENTVFDENVEAAVEIARLRRDVIAHRRIIWPLRSVIGELESKLRRFATRDLEVYFGDVMDHLNKIWDTLDEVKETIEVFKDTDYVLSNERLGRIMRVLTVLATVVLPFLIISSLYGMNVHMPGSIEQGNHFAFWILMAIMTAFAGGLLWFFRRKHWI